MFSRATIRLGIGHILVFNVTVCDLLFGFDYCLEAFCVASVFIELSN